MKKIRKAIPFLLLLPALLACQLLSPTPAAPAPIPLETEIEDAKGVTMRLVPAGEFIMGSDDEQAGDAQPAHTVTLPDFYMDVYEVTRARYQECFSAGACSDSINVPSLESYFESPNLPMSSLNWEQAKTYCEWRGARLPSEAEWEKAARGTNGRTYPWGEVFDEEHVQLSGGPHEVGIYELGKSPYGMYDMSGNVWEWTSDAPVPYPGYQGDQGHFRETDRVLRGGSWEAPDPAALSTWFRFFSFEGDNAGYVGFRCAREVTP